MSPDLITAAHKPPFHRIATDFLATPDEKRELDDISDNCTVLAVELGLLARKLESK